MTRSPVTVVLPSYEEYDSLQVLLPQVLAALQPSDQVLVVYDGNDRREAQLPSEFGIEAIPGRNAGLGPAICLGLLQAAHDHIIVMDADGQHPASLIPQMASELMRNDMVACYRVATPDWSWHRRLMSCLCALLCKPLIDFPDPMTGAFGVARHVGEGDLKLHIHTWKIGLELLVKGNYASLGKCPYTFQPRIQGQSKAGLKSAGQFLRQLAQLYLWKIDLSQMLKFCVVGTSGLLVNFGSLLFLVEVLGMDYRPAAIIGIGTAMVWNYLWNKFWTFKTVRSKKPFQVLEYPNR